MDNTIDLMNRASSSLTPASFPGKEKGRRKKAQSRKYRNVILEEVSYTLSPHYHCCSLPNPCMDPRVGMKKDLEASDYREFTLTCRIQKGGKNKQWEHLCDRYRQMGLRQ